MGKIFNIILLIAGIVALVMAFDYFSPVKVSSLISGTGLESGTCLKVTNIDTNQMEPILTQGESVVFDKCVEGKREDLEEGTVILIERGYFEKDDIKIIRRKIQRATGDFYQVSTSTAPNEFEEIQPENIKAIYTQP